MYTSILWEVDTESCSVHPHTMYLGMLVGYPSILYSMTLFFSNYVRVGMPKYYALYCRSTYTRVSLCLLLWPKWVWTKGGIWEVIIKAMTLELSRNYFSKLLPTLADIISLPFLYILLFAQVQWCTHTPVIRVLSVIQMFYWRAWEPHFYVVHMLGTKLM